MAAVTVATVSAADLSECTEVNAQRNLYLKPIARLVIVVTMPTLKVSGKTFFWLPFFREFNSIEFKIRMIKSKRT